MKTVIVTIAMTVVSMVSYSQTNKISEIGDNMEGMTYINHRSFETPKDEWYSYGDGVAFYLETTSVEKFEEAFEDVKAHYELNEQPDDIIKVSDMRTGETVDAKAYHWTHSEGYEFMVIVHEDMIIVADRGTIFYMW